MIEMGVRQDHCIDIRRIDREFRPVPSTDFTAPLEQSALHEYPLASDFDQGLRAGDGANTADERQKHDAVVSPAIGG